MSDAEQSSSSTQNDPAVHDPSADDRAAVEQAALATDPALLQHPSHDGPADADVEPLSHDTQSGERDYVATSPLGVSAERGNPLPEDEQGRGTEYDPADQGPQREG